ncbi:hypothetical protein ABFT23_15650 [Nocardioides sp. C4-1]|uniref:rhamnosyltransferase WsaF family glycosyltransferase n=1 Tax=Nocardioides sp. C4-1 TaxID=3151851 RepID=UPI003263D9C7
MRFDPLGRRAAVDLAQAAERTRRLRRRNRRLSGRVAELEQELERRPPVKPASTDWVKRGHQRLHAIHHDGERPQVVLVLHGFSSAVVFAGVTTAVHAAARLCRELDRRLRVVIFDTDDEPDAVRSALATILGSRSDHADLARDVRVSTPHADDGLGHHRDDVWVVTYWTTAEGVATLADAGRVDRRRVVYLVQDFEPAFHPWGDHYARALATYASGFRLLVNSRPLSRYVADRTGAALDPDAVFAPALAFGELAETARRWRPAEPGVIRVLFYARPSKPRNMFSTGVGALRAWAAGLPEGQRAVVRLAGEDIADPVDLGGRAEVEMLGKTSLEAYYDVLADTDIGLALMLSPHPGHLALEMPAAGIPTVTNQFDGYREPWVAGLDVADATPAGLAHALAEVAGRLPVEHRATAYAMDLGGRLDDAVSALVSSMDEPRR